MVVDINSNDVWGQLCLDAIKTIKSFLILQKILSIKITTIFLKRGRENRIKHSSFKKKQIKIQLK